MNQRNRKERQQILNLQPYNRIALCFIIALIVNTCLRAENKLNIFINGPSYTKHFVESDSKFVNFHVGVGFEFDKVLHKKWLWGGHFHFMFNDSANYTAYWGGPTIGYLIGNRKGLWLQPILIAGVMKKNEYFNGKLHPFCLPFISMGYRSLGFNISIIPPIQDNPSWILMLQIKARIK
jgi:hypothetical protein